MQTSEQIEDVQLIHRKALAKNRFVVDAGLLYRLLPFEQLGLTDFHPVNYPEDL